MALMVLARSCLGAPVCRRLQGFRLSWIKRPLLPLYWFRYASERMDLRRCDARVARARVAAASLIADEPLKPRLGAPSGRTCRGIPAHARANSILDRCAHAALL